MPIPKPKINESRDDFVDRCMTNETMKKDFPDNDQRVAVCMETWRDNKRSVRSNFFQDHYEMRFDQNSNRIEGYAAKFNTRSQDLGGFTETIRPGAFKKTLKEADIRVLMNHDSNLVLGRNKSGTAKLWEDEVGLRFSVELPNTTYANDLKEVMSRGDISQCSFGFIPVDDEWNNDYSERTLKQVRLFDASVVTYPAYEDTEAQLREMPEVRSNAIKKNVKKKIGIEIEYIKKDILEELRGGPQEKVKEKHPQEVDKTHSDLRARNIKSKIFAILEE